MFLSLTHTRTTHTKHQDFMENLNSSFVWMPKTISNILLEVSMIDDFSKKSTRLDSYVHLLEEEMRKIQVFQRELPQCMNLIQDAIERLKEESSKWKARQAGPVMEQFLPLKSDPIGNGGPKSSLVHPKEKTNWLSSVQLWSNPIHPGQNQADSILHLGEVKYQEGEGSRLLQGCNIKNRGGAFVPFKKPIAVEEDRKRVDDDGLSLSIPTNVPAEEGVKERGDSTQLNTQQQQQKKHRRCWSPELHKQFVDALQQLGGPKSATPKQIRDLMNVDGLTNDEVKSHLQKYRIHLKKLPSSSTGPLAKFSWNDNCADVARAMPGQSSSPQGPFQNGGSAKVGSTTGGDSMEEDEDDKSESQSWRSRFQGPGDKRA